MAFKFPKLPKNPMNMKNMLQQLPNLVPPSPLPESSNPMANAVAKPRFAYLKKKLNVRQF